MQFWQLSPNNNCSIDTIISCCVDWSFRSMVWFHFSLAFIHTIFLVFVPHSKLILSINENRSIRFKTIHNIQMVRHSNHNKFFVQFERERMVAIVFASDRSTKTSQNQSKNNGWEPLLFHCFLALHVVEVMASFTLHTYTHIQCQMSHAKCDDCLIKSVGVLALRSFFH